nr:GTPase ObgE [uncultured Oribacterium sp.]
MFADIAKIYVKSGKGGNGHVSFRRELFVPAGGPDGGDGGKGGDIIVEVDKGLNSLEPFRHKTKYAAEPGQEGDGRKMHGKNGKDLILKVPEGTLLKDDETGKLIADMSGENQRMILLKGGKGGLGNMHFATPAMQAPKFAQPGEEAREITLRMELRVIADVGLVGYPNVGKSTLLSMCSNARPEIANYHFTTLNPHLGVVNLKGDRSFVMADIPGIIEGASSGVGLGFQFLRHIHRSRVLIHMVDAAGTEGRKPLDDFLQIQKECEKYDKEILRKPMIVAANKIELVQSEEQEEDLALLEKYCTEHKLPFFRLSAASNQGILPILEKTWELLEENKEQAVVYESEVDLENLGAVEMLAISYDHPEEGVFVVEGPKMEKMLGYTNLEAEKGFLFFQRFMVEQGIIKELKKMGLKEGDTIKIYAHEFEYYDTEDEE